LATIKRAEQIAKLKSGVPIRDSAPTAKTTRKRGESADVSRREVCLAMELRCGGDRPAPMIPGMVLRPVHGGAAQLAWSRFAITRDFVGWPFHRALDSTLGTASS